VNIVYDLTFANDPGAPPIDIVDIGMPNNTYNLSEIKASVNGVPLTNITDSPYVKPGVAVELGSNAIQPGRTGTLHLEATVRDLIYQDSPYGKGVQSAVNGTITKGNLNIELVSQQTFKMGESDYRTVLTSIKNADPDVVYVAAFLNEQIPIETQARRDVGLNKIFTAVEPNDDPDFYTGVGTYADYSIVQSRFSPYTAPVGAVSVAHRITG
jgi:hypothetical protein